MASRPSFLVHFEQKGISITIEIDLIDLLEMA
jgi:hypothetical protein